MSKLNGKVAVVTGASKGIGAAIAKSLAAEGASVVVNYASSKSGADAVVADITAAGGQAVAVGGDVSKAAEAQGIIDAAIKNFGRLDILVNNSGVYEFAPIEAVTEKQFHKIFNINVLGAILTTQAAVKHLGEGASIINIGSNVSRLTPANSTAGPRERLTPSPVCSPVNSDQGRSGSTPSTPAWSRPKAHRLADSSALISRKTSSRRLHSAAPVKLAISPRSLSFWLRTILPGLLASSFWLPEASARPPDETEPGPIQRTARL